MWSSICRVIHSSHVLGLPHDKCWYFAVREHFICLASVEKPIDAAMSVGRLLAIMGAAGRKTHQRVTGRVRLATFSQKTAAFIAC